MTNNQPHITAEKIAECVSRFRSQKPHVHCITNSVAQNFTANVLLAAGATPSMTVAVSEIGAFVEMADALLINLGTLDPERIRAVNIAAERANQLAKPWVLDPVFVQASASRLELAKFLLGKRPSLVRCNAGEGKALLGDGFDPHDLSKLKTAQVSALALTGKEDRVVVGEQSMSVLNGHQFMDRVTAMGCALTALIAGFMATEEDAALAIASALVLFGLAGEVAGKGSNGPGSFAPAFLDALHNLNQDEIKQGAKIR
jgi:hydroxyethylthiazole kinase